MSKFTRVIGGTRPRFRLYGGWEQRDSVTYKGKILKGFIRLRKQNSVDLRKLASRTQRGLLRRFLGIIQDG